MSLWQKLKTGLSKTTSQITDGLKNFIGMQQLSAEQLQNIEEILIKADCGVQWSAEIIGKLKTMQMEERSDGMAVHHALSRLIEEQLAQYEGTMPFEYINKPNPEVIMLVGVNGGGKTTSLAKIAQFYKSRGDKPLLVAGDSFRAAAVEQLELWANRLGVGFFRKDDRADPAAIAYESYMQAKQRGYNKVLLDTAGRLHTKHNLMEEMAKIIRVLQKCNEFAPHQCLLVLDATAGQNAIEQAKKFAEFAPLTGLIITKLDGTARAGVVCQIVKLTKLPIIAIGVGESADDWQVFSAHKFANALVGLGDYDD